MPAQDAAQGSRHRLGHGEELGMSVHQGNGHAPALGPGRTRVVIEGVAALVGMAALSATLFGMLTWAVVQLVRMLAG